MTETIETIAETAQNVTEMMESASHFLGLICNPAAEEIGYYLQDDIRLWRMENIAKVATEAEIILKSNGTIDGLSAPPRLVYKIMKEGSLIDDKDVQKMWAGLLASSCTLDGKDESNLIYINLLSKLTSSEVAFMNHLCNCTRKGVTDNGLIFAEFTHFGLDNLQTNTGFKDFHKINQVITNLESLGLLHFVKNDGSTFLHVLKPTRLCLNMYVKCQGSSESPIEYWSECLHR